MDRRRAAGALLALAACIACSAAAPTASNHTALDLYEGAPEGCYYNFQHYGEGDRIMTNEPCLNCTCHNRMLMCYLRVCPFTKPIGQDCTVEKRADQCCPIVTCPDVPVDLLTSTSTSSPAEYGATGLGKLDKYGCSINGKYFPEGSKVPPTPNKPCEHCYCIRNMTTCVMQECTLHVDGCTPIYHKDVCCPVRYSCDHPEDEVPLLDDMSTTVRPTPGFLLTTTTLSPVTQMTQDCVHNEQIIADGASITTEKACEHCYCMKGDIVCVVQECGAPMENEGKNCTSLPPREGQCCPDTYICEGDELASEITTESSPASGSDQLTTLSPPRRGGVEGSGYRNEPNEVSYTEVPTMETELEGSGEEQEPITPEESTPTLEEVEQYIPVTTKAPSNEESKTTTKEIDRTGPEEQTVKTHLYLPTTQVPVEKDDDKMTTEGTEDESPKPYEDVSVTGTTVQESYDKVTTEAGEALNTVPDVVSAEEHEKPQEYSPSTTNIPEIVESATTVAQESEEPKGTPDSKQDVTLSPISESTEHLTSGVDITDIERATTVKLDEATELTTEKKHTDVEGAYIGTTYGPVAEKGEEQMTEKPGKISDKDDTFESGQYTPITTVSSIEDIRKLTTEPDHSENTVAVTDEESPQPHIPSFEEAERITVPDLGAIVTEKEHIHEPHEHISTPMSILEESKLTTAEPDKGLNTIPSEISEESSSEPSFSDKTTIAVDVKSTEPSVIIDTTELQEAGIKSPTPSPESHITKGDQYTITTEPSFRKEDEASVSVGIAKEETESTTIKVEFVDEGLIPTSVHDDKLSTGSHISSLEEDVTTLVPELEETVESKQPTTESYLGTSLVSESLPEKDTQTTYEQESGVLSSTEKSDLTPSIYEEPSRIPGEGDCLLNGVTYKNNTVVPSTNNCHTGCKCVSSIIKCDPIICSPPPDYMDNCQSIYDTPDSCCPTYVCDHPRETIPPQSDNQMSGTESPLSPPTIECRGDQCELIEPSKEPIEPTEPCTTENCLSAPEKKPETSECGIEGCSSVVKQPDIVVASDEHGLCANGKCEPPVKSCANGKCQLSPTDSQVSPIKPCEGDNCKSINEETPAPQLCKNEDECKPQEIIPSDCTGDEPCRRKDVSVPQELPSKCEGNNCEQEIDTQDVHQLSTESTMPKQTPSEEVTDINVPAKEEKPIDSQVSGQEKVDTTPITQFVTLQEHRPTEPSIHETTEVGTKTDKETEQVSEVQIATTEETDYTLEEGTKKPITTGLEETEKSTEEEATETPTVIEKDATQNQEATENDKEVEDVTKLDVSDKDHIHKHTLGEEVTTSTPKIVEEEPTSKPVLFDKDETKTPEGLQEGTTFKPSIIKETSTKIYDTTEKDTGKPVSGDKEASKISDMVEEHTYKQDYLDEEGTKIPDVVESHTGKPSSGDEEGTEIPEAIEEYTGKPALIDEEDSKIPYEIEDTDKPALIDEEDTRIPDGVEEHTGKPVHEVGTKVPEDVEELTTKPISVDEQGIKTSDAGYEATGKPVLSAEESTKAPDTEEDYTSKPTATDEESSKVSVTIDEHTDKPSVGDEEDTKISSDVEEHTGKLDTIDNGGTKAPDVVEDHTGKPALVEEAITSTDAVEVHTDKPTPIEEQGTKVSDAIEDHTGKTTPIHEEGTKISDTVEDHTSKPTLIDEEGIKVSDAIEDHTGRPTLIDEEGTEVSDAVAAHTDKPASADEESSHIPEDVEEHTGKPVSVHDEGTKVPEDVENYTTKPTEEGIKISDATEAYTGKPDSVDEEGIKTSDTVEDHTGKPDLVDEEGVKTPETVEEPIGTPAPVEEEGTRVPDIVEIHDGKPDLIDDEGVKVPVVVDEHTGKPTSAETTTNIPDTIKEYTSKPGLYDGHGTKIQDAIEEHTSKPVSVVEEGTKLPDTEQKYTVKPTAVDEEVTKTPDIVKEHTAKPDSVDEEGVMTPVIVEEYTGKPALVDKKGTEIPDVDEEHTDTPTSATEKGMKVNVEDYTGKPSSADEESKMPDAVKEHTDKPTAHEEEGTKIPDIVEEYTDKTTSLYEDGTKTPSVVEEYTSKPVSGTEEGIKIPDDIKEHTGKPALIDEERDKIPDAIEEHTDKPNLVDKDGDKIPDAIEEHTGIPALVDEEGDKIPHAIEEHPGKPALVDEEGDKKPDTIEEQTGKPVLVDEEGEKILDVVEEHTGSSGLVEYDTTKIPDVKEQTEKPATIEEGTKKPDFLEMDYTIKPVPGEKEITTTHDVVTDKIDITDEQSHPILVDEELPEEPTAVKESADKKPSMNEDEGTTESPIFDGKVTEIFEDIKDTHTKKPVLIDESMGTPVEVEVVTEKLTTGIPIVINEESKDRPSLVQEGAYEPVDVEKEHTTSLVEQGHTDSTESTVSEIYEHVIPGEGGSGTEVPEYYEPEKEPMLPETSSELPKTTESIEKATKTPIYEPQTITSEEGAQTESYLEPIDVHGPELSTTQEPSTSSDVKAPDSLTVPQDSETVAPDVHAHEFATESLTEQEKATKVPITISETTLPPLREGDQETHAPSEHTTSPQEPFTNVFEVTRGPESIATTGPIEKATKPTEPAAISEHGEVYTDIPEQEYSVTKSPGEVVIEPQEGEQSKTPVAGALDEESSTKTFEEGYVKPSPPETHASDTVLGSAEGTSALPVIEIVTEIPEHVDMEHTGLPHDSEPEKTPTQASFDVSEHEVKTGQPDIFTPEKEEMITSSITSAVTEPVKSFTEIEDSSITGQEETSTGYYEESTESFEPSVTEQSDTSSETPLVFETKATKGPEVSYSESHEAYTEATVPTDAKPSDSYVPQTPEISTVASIEESTATESPKLSEESPETGKPILGVSDESTETLELEKETTVISELAATELPVSIVTSPPEKTIVPEENTVSQEEYTTPSGVSDKIHSGTPTAPPEIYVSGEQEATEIPASQVTASAEPEPSATESSYTEQQTTDVEETGMKSEEPEATDIHTPATTSDISVKPGDIEMQAPDLEHTDLLEPDVKEHLPEVHKASTESPAMFEEVHTEYVPITTEASLSLVTGHEIQPHDKEPTVHEAHTESQDIITAKPDITSSLPEVTTLKQTEEITKFSEQTSGQAEFSETTPYLIELEEHTHKIVDDLTTISEDEDHTYKAVVDISTPSLSEEDYTRRVMQDVTTASPTNQGEHTFKIPEEHISTVSPSVEGYTYKIPEDTSAVSPSIGKPVTVHPEGGLHGTEESTEKVPIVEIETPTKPEVPSEPSIEFSTISEPISYQTTLSVPEEVSEKLSETPVSTESSQGESTIVPTAVEHKYDVEQKNVTTSKPVQVSEDTTDIEKLPVTESDIAIPTEKESSVTKTPAHPPIQASSQVTAVPEDELIFATMKPTIVKQDEMLTPVPEDKDGKPEEKPASEIPPSSTPEVPKPPAELQPTDEIPTPDEDGHFPPSGTGYGEPDYGEEDQAFGPGTCRYGGKVYVSAQQIPRDDPCDFCFCFRSDIICLQQSCPPPIHGCHEEPIQGFCCPRYECPVSMATTVNVTTTTTTTTTTLPPHFPTHSYKGAAQRRGCQIKGHTYKVGEVVRSSSGPCLHCTCGGDGQMKCDPKACTPEPMLRQMIAAAVSAKRRR